MIKIAQKAALLLEYLPALRPDPIGAIAHRVNPAFESPAGLGLQRRPVSATLPKVGPSDRPGAILGLCRHQPHLLPLAGDAYLS